MDKLQKITSYYAEKHPYKEAISILRDLVLQTNLTETYKWNFPTYTLHGKNVLAICKFKAHFSLWFFKGVLLSDPLNVLTNAQAGKTQYMRHWKFSAPKDIDSSKIKAYIAEAISLEKPT